MGYRTVSVPVLLPDGSEILVEAVVEPGEQDISGRTSLPSIEPALEAIESFSTALGRSLQKIAPRTAQVEFGIQLTVGSSGLAALLLQGSGTSSLKVTLTWGT